MLGRFAADQGASRLNAALRNAGYDCRNLFGHVLPDGYVIKEKQGLCAAAYYIVYAHGHAVYADGIMPVHKLRKAQLGAHAIGAGYEYRLRHASNVWGKQSAEAADIGNHARDIGALNVCAHELNALITGGYVYAGCRVCGGAGFFHINHSFPFQQYVQIFSGSMPMASITPSRD